MPHAYTEDQLVEQPAIGLFAELGWQTAAALPLLLPVLMLMLLVTTVELATVIMSDISLLFNKLGMRPMARLKFTINTVFGKQC